MYFIFETKFSWNKGIDTCFNVEYVLFGHNFDFLGCYLMVTAGYYSLPGGYWWLTARYRSLLLVPTFSMNVQDIIQHIQMN